AHVLEQKSKDYLKRQIYKAKKWLVAQSSQSQSVALIDELNKKYFYARIVGKAAIVEEIITNKSRHAIVPMTPYDFKIHLGHQFIWTNDGEANNPKKISHAEYFLEHSGKRRFNNGLVFDPAYQGSDYYNLWRGFAVNPKPVDCVEFLARSKFLRHL